MTTLAPVHTRSLSDVFDPRANGLNFVRLSLALGVIVWHSFALSGIQIGWHPLRQLLGEIWVDGFFAISGFLIVSSWTRDPNAARYLRARLLRILPAFWVCLLVTAFFIAPLATGSLGSNNISYVVRNLALWVFQFDIDGTPRSVPYPGVWNGSIWTLAWEFGCYLLVLGLGVTGLIRRRATLWTLFILCVGGTAAASLGLITNWFLITGSRFGIMFIAGAIVWQHRDRIPVNRVTVIGSVAVVISSLALPDYRLLSALPLAFLVLVAGAKITTPRLRLRNDISYGVYIYAFPLQQVLAICGAWTLGIPAFATLAMVATIPIAALSWFAVEKPALRFKSTQKKRWPTTGFFRPKKNRTPSK